MPSALRNPIARLLPSFALSAAILALPIAAMSHDRPDPQSSQRDAKDASPISLVTACAHHDGWADPAPPVHVFGNTWYVGTCGITALLVTSPQGDVLIDGGVPDAAPLVLANIRKLGRDPQKVRWIIATHEHYDHVGALAALQRATGAKVAALPAQAQVLERGQPQADDPQAGSLPGFAPVKISRILVDGASFTWGGLRFTPHATPVHAPGSTSWTWQSCENKVCRTIAYVDSATTISADGYRFSDHPRRIAEARKGLKTMAALPCDILITPHPSASDTFARIDGLRPLIAPGACRTYAQVAAKRLTARLQSEQ